jgi:hypothetical protein
VCPKIDRPFFLFGALSERFPLASENESKAAAMVSGCDGEKRNCVKTSFGANKIKPSSRGDRPFLLEARTARPPLFCFPLCPQRPFLKTLEPSQEDF